MTMNTLKRTLLPLLALVLAASSACADEAVLQSILGPVTVKISAAAAPVKGRPGMRLPQGAEVSTAASARAVIRFNATDVVRLGPGTTLNVAAVNQGTATSRDTVLRVLVGSVRAMLNRSGHARKMNFAIAAGAAVCAVKGTEWDLYYPDPSKPPEVVVAQGTVQVGTSGPDLAAVMTALHQMGVGVGGTPVPAGFHVQVDSDGHVSRPAPAPVRTTLEVVSMTGKVLVTLDGKTTEVHPGEEIPSGATIQVVGGDAVLSAPGQSVSAGDGSTFTFNASSTSGGVTTGITVASGSTPVLVETGGSVATVTGGTAVSIAVSGGSAPTITSTQGTVSVTNAAGGTATVQEGQTVSTAVKVVPSADVNGQGAISDETAVASTPVVVMPPAPPDTTNQNRSVISPSAP